MAPPPRSLKKTLLHQEEMFAEITIKPFLLKQEDKQDSLSNDFEWDNDFAESTETLENQKLLSKEDRENDNTVPEGRWHREWQHLWEQQRVRPVIGTARIFLSGGLLLKKKMSVDPIYILAMGKCLELELKSFVCVYSLYMYNDVYWIRYENSFC